jgi:hypothetical protein
MMWKNGNLCEMFMGMFNDVAIIENSAEVLKKL